MKTLIDIAYEASTIYASALPGEEFHKDYRKEKSIFRNVVRTDTELENQLTSYFKDFASRIEQYIDWNAYQGEALTASIKDFILANWDEEALNLRVILTGTLVFAITAGGNLLEKETGIDIGWSSKEHPAIEFLNKYTVKLAKQLTDTTEKRIRQSLALSIQNGESQTQAVSRLASVIDDPKRAARIAHTETVRAFSAGRMEVARQIGATHKMWDATVGPCPLCQALDNKVVSLDELFDGEYDAPPRHPNCRCLVKIFMPGEIQASEILHGGWVTLRSGKRIFIGPANGSWKAAGTRTEAEEFSKNSVITQDVFHGTKGADVSSIKEYGFRTGWGKAGKGSYFTDDLTVANSYARNQKDPHTLTVKINITNPKITSSREMIAESERGYGLIRKDFGRYIKDIQANHDSIILQEGGHTEYVVFKRSQVMVVEQ